MGDNRPATLQHSAGLLEVHGPDLVSEMSGTTGMFRKRTWSKTERWPVADIRSVAVQKEQFEKWPRLVIYTTASGSQPAVAYMACQPADELTSLLEALVAANPMIAVATVDAARPSPGAASVQVHSLSNALTVYTVTAGRLTVKSGLLRQEQSMPLRNVQEVRVEKSLTGYRVRITSAGGVILTDALLPASAERLRNAILGR